MNKIHGEYPQRELTCLNLAKRQLLDAAQIRGFDTASKTIFRADKYQINVYTYKPIYSFHVALFL